jgi:hypothetical protein
MSTRKYEQELVKWFEEKLDSAFSTFTSDDTTEMLIKHDSMPVSVHVKYDPQDEMLLQIRGKIRYRAAAKHIIHYPVTSDPISFPEAGKSIQEIIVALENRMGILTNLPVVFNGRSLMVVSDDMVFETDFPVPEAAKLGKGHWAKIETGAMEAMMRFAGIGITRGETPIFRAGLPDGETFTLSMEFSTFTVSLRLDLRTMFGPWLDMDQIKAELYRPIETTVRVYGSSLRRAIARAQTVRRDWQKAGGHGEPNYSHVGLRIAPTGVAVIPICRIAANGRFDKSDAEFPVQTVNGEGVMGEAIGRESILKAFSELSDTLLISFSRKWETIQVSPRTATTVTLLAAYEA